MKEFSSDEKPLVTIFGGAGYIGSILTRLLLAENFRVRVFDNFLFGDIGIKGLIHDDLEVIEGDLTDTKAVSVAVEGSETIILLASVIGHRIENIRRTDLRNVNLLGSSVLLDAALEHGVSRFIFASTNSIYGVQSGMIYETTIPEPVSLFSRLKLRMEERVIRAKSKYFHPTALRIASCHGFSPRMRFDLVVNRMVRDAVFKKEIHINGGEQFRALIHVEDVARAFLSCINAHVNLVSGQIFNVAAKDQIVQVNYLANIAKSIFHDIKVVVHPMEPDLKEFRISSSRIEKILDFTPRWSIENSMTQLKEILESGVVKDPYSLKHISG
ncbi:MAG: NAD(P)-dependent oxidoreductase [Proteobacteria bacterium]|nr:NAD(P)-dependent oxidoreductase [Pseudomonadota bacterium]